MNYRYTYEHLLINHHHIFFFLMAANVGIYAVWVSFFFLRSWGLTSFVYFAP